MSLLTPLPLWFSQTAQPCCQWSPQTERDCETQSVPGEREKPKQKCPRTFLDGDRAHNKASWAMTEQEQVRNTRNLGRAFKPNPCHGLLFPPPPPPPQKKQCHPTWRQLMTNSISLSFLAPPTLHEVLPAPDISDNLCLPSAPINPTQTISPKEDAFCPTLSCYPIHQDPPDQSRRSLTLILVVCQDNPGPQEWWSSTPASFKCCWQAFP